MEVLLRPLVSCRFYTTIIKQRKKDFGEIEKIENTLKRGFTLRLRISLFVCVCVCVCGLYNWSITDIEHSTNYTTFGLP